MPASRLLAAGEGWRVAEVVCGAGPRDNPFEERHELAAVGVVVAGTFEYRSSSGEGLMVPGALLLGNAGDHFLCRHDHGTGDRCIAFSYLPEFLERLAREIGPASGRFGSPRLPPLRPVAPLVARAAALALDPDALAAGALAAEVAAIALGLERGLSPPPASAEASALARVSRVVRALEHEPSAPRDIDALARLAGLSPFHFIRAFRAVTGVTPHQYLLRLRLQRAARLLCAAGTTVAEIAYGCGFGDVSNFNRTFRAEFSLAPRAYRGLAVRGGR